ncbi:hypothetical protein ACFL9T_21830 [Thermodesulfobacteriota bacterium]
MTRLNVKKAFLLSILVVVSALFIAFINPLQASISKEWRNRIIFIEHAGYLETLDDVYDIDPGDYNFIVSNKSNKDASFVLTRQGEEPQVISIKNGQIGMLRVNLKSGIYSYYCPLIPTPVYKITVK